MRTASRTATRTAAQIAARTARSPHDVVSSRAVSNQVLQASLKVGPVDDPLEREADAVADALVQGEAAGPVRSGPASVVRRQPMPLPGAAPGSPPPPVMEPLRPLVTTWEVDTKTDAQKLGKGAGEAAGAALDTGPGKALQDAATAQLERDWQKASPGDRALMVIAAVQALAGVAALKAIPEADEGPPAPDKTPRIKISRDFKVQLEFKLGWKDKGPDGTETQRRTPRIDAVTVSLFYTPEGPKGPPDAELVAAEIARLQAALAPFRPKPTGDGFAVDYAVRRMLEERTRRPSWLRSEEGAARAREADRFKLDAGPFAARPQPGVRLVPELELGPMPPPGKVQRKCAACAAEEHTDETIRLKSAGPAAGPPAAAGADAAVAGLDRGTPLPAAERRFFEARLGRDFSAVRLHSDNTGAVTIGARAFTLGRQVAFAPGEWRPGTVEGRRLLAHELVHVVQQDAAAERAVRRQPADAIGQSDKDDEEGKERAGTAADPHGGAKGPAKADAPAEAGPAGADKAPEVAGPTAAGSTTGQPAPSAGGSASTTAPLAPAVTVTPGGHAAAPPGVAPCPDPPTRNLVVVGCTAKAAAAPPAVEKAELPTLNPARFGGDADRARFAKELAQCHAARTVKDEIDRRYRAAVEAARKQATDQAKQDTDAAIKAATENIPPGDRAALARAKAQAVADAKKAATKKISDAQAAVTRQDVAAVTAELSTRLENELATDYDETLKGALGRYGPGWLATMQAALNRRRAKITKEKNTKPKVARGETPPPPKPAAEIAADIEAEMVEVRCEQQEWVLDRIERVARGWAVARREQVDFSTIPQKAAGLGNFVPTYDPPPASRVDIPGTAGMAGVAPELGDFLTRLAADLKGDPKVPSFRAENRAGHGGGKVSEPRHFAGKGFSVDIYITAPTDQRGFWQPGAAVAFLLQLDATARAFGARWRVLYDDFRVAQAVNEATGVRNVEYMATSGGGKLNWHGPDPLILHFHLDLEVPQKPALPAGGTP